MRDEFVDTCGLCDAPLRMGQRCACGDNWRAAQPAPAQPAVADLRNAMWLDPECADAGACQSLRFKAARPAPSAEQQPVANRDTPALHEAARLYIDGEWNSYNGQLISMALVAEDGREWYEVMECFEPIDEWVADNVMPKLGKAPVSPDEFRASLAKFLAQFKAIHIVADWPEDIEWFCRTIVTGPGQRLDTPPLTMEVVRVDPVSSNPHNALADARALRAAIGAGEGN